MKNKIKLAFLLGKFTYNKFLLKKNNKNFIYNNISNPGNIFLIFEKKIKNILYYCNKKIFISSNGLKGKLKKKVKNGKNLILRFPYRFNKIFNFFKIKKNIKIIKIFNILKKNKNLKILKIKNFYYFDKILIGDYNSGKSTLIKYIYNLKNNINYYIFTTKNSYENYSFNFINKNEKKNKIIKIKDTCGNNNFFIKKVENESNIKYIKNSKKIIYIIDLSFVFINIFYFYNKIKYLKNNFYICKKSILFKNKIIFLNKIDIIYFDNYKIFFKKIFYNLNYFNMFFLLTLKKKNFYKFFLLNNKI